MSVPTLDAPFKKTFTVDKIPVPHRHFVDMREKSNYITLKEDIQKSLLGNNPVYRFDVVFPIGGIANHQQLKDGLLLSNVTFSRIHDNLTNRGFAVITTPKDDCRRTDGSTVRGYQATVFIPEDPQDENGYTSDGWVPSFKASYIRGSIADATTRSWKETAKLIEGVITEHPDVLSHTFGLSPSCPPGMENLVTENLVNELQDRGFTASSEGPWITVNLLPPTPPSTPTEYIST